MEEPLRVFQSDIIKLAIVGEPGSGKTNFIKHFAHKDTLFKEQYISTIGVDFALKSFVLENQQSVSLQMWDIAGHNKVNNFNMLSVYFKAARIFIITISADQAEDAKLKQIDEWLDIIQNKGELPYKVILLETKSDVTTECLTKQQIARFVKTNNSIKQEKKLTCDAYMLISSKNKTNFVELDKLLKKMFYEVEPQLNQANEVEPIIQHNYSPIIIEDDVTAAINALEDDQAEQLLFFVEHSIRRGVGISLDKPYEVRWFSGTTYQYKSVMNPDIAWPEIELNLPRHIPELLDLVKQKGEISSKAILCQIYSKSLDIAKSDSFSRKSSTQYFYQHLLPNYYKKSLQPATLNIYKDINALSNAQALSIIQSIGVRLLEGNKRDTKPYKLGLFGGVSYKTQSETIKIPEHVNTMLTFIDEHLNESKFTSKQLLRYIYEYTMFAALSPNSSRDPSTQQFYETLLPEFIKHQVALSSSPSQESTNAAMSR